MGGRLVRAVLVQLNYGVVVRSLRLGILVYGGLDKCHGWPRLVCPSVDQEWAFGSTVGLLVGKRPDAISVGMALEWD
jgi:hypothetical protein